MKIQNNETQATLTAPDFTEYINNHAQDASGLTFYPLRGNKKEHRPGAELQPNGDISFCIRAPQACRVEVAIDGLTVHRGNRVNILELEAAGAGFPEVRLELNRTEDGYFEGILNYGELEGYYGPLGYTFIVDGAYVLNPGGRTAYRDGRMANIIEIPDQELQDEFLIKNVPHGAVSYELFWSETRQDISPCLVYTPPEYYKGDREYPVLYLQHGGGENETGWFTLGSVAPIMDNLIAEGLAKPAVIVMNNTQMSSIIPNASREELSSGEKMFGAVESLIINDCIPFIESRYRVRTDKWGRAIAGLSQGSMQSSFVGFGHPEVFGYLGFFSSSIRCRHYWEKYEDNPHLAKVCSDPKSLEEDYRVIYRGVGEQEHESRPWHKEDDAFILKQGISDLSCYHRSIHPVMCHEWGCFRRSLYEFVQLIFR